MDILLLLPAPHLPPPPSPSGSGTRGVLPAPEEVSPWQTNDDEGPQIHVSNGGELPHRVPPRPAKAFFVHCGTLKKTAQASLILRISSKFRKGSKRRANLERPDLE
ncbi:hypothetical protein JMJ77_0007858 [Colletotrichum scovillei]|uniref:Uncharacterized protein n=1 Tax=Colletotrichum scovillei TaxID=1209932 RepID=A0A9P7RDN4_9PEZI|nr:hypothetical protein JMJ77_0007858 [Colletotrichum scovillei]KAG7074868.1 hypothetical protein JMJ76_0011336 [Colletotrichum scovillei]KAG7081905.1 hypothetical protein JMJ78_0004017 [Colletotrichum scovillei]